MYFSLSLKKIHSVFTCMLYIPLRHCPRSDCERTLKPVERPRFDAVVHMLEADLQLLHRLYSQETHELADVAESVL